MPTLCRVIATATESPLPAQGFHVRVADFDGPFDLLLQLIGKHRLEVTELALHQVTDEFISYIREQEGSWSLDEATEFLVVAATLLDLKAARLLPSGEVEDEEDIAVLEARDLLFARLLQYRAYKEVAQRFALAFEQEASRHARTVPLEERFAALLPDVMLLGTEAFALLAGRALAPRPQPIVGVSHLHAPQVSVREQAAHLAQRLQRAGALTFRQLIVDATSTLVVVARFLALLELYRDGRVAFDQVAPLGDLHVRWHGGEAADTADIDEFEGWEQGD